MHRQVIKFNQIVLGIKARTKGLMPDNEAEISTQCLIEEANEFEDAHMNGDYIGCIDAVIDSVYFSFGMLYKLGLTAEEIQKIFTEVHLANMEKIRGVNVKRNTGAADAIKPHGWISPEERIAKIIGSI